MMDFAFRALPDWPYPPTRPRRGRYAFKASWSNTLRLLESELRQLDGRQWRSAASAPTRPGTRAGTGGALLMPRITDAIAKLELSDPPSGRPLVTIVHVLEYDEDEGWRPVSCGGWALVEPIADLPDAMQRLADAPEFPNAERMAAAIERLQR